MKQIIAKFIADEQGQDIIEYALVGSFVSFGCIAGARALASGYDNWFTGIAGVVEDSVPTVTP
jgi:Flp pilus assembly pilin Flp